MIRPTKSILAAGLLGVLIAGCSLKPDYNRPQLPVADALPGVSEAATTTPDGVDVAVLPELGWRDYFTDPALQNLIAAALENNRDLRTSALTIAVYQAQYRIQRSALFPTLDGDASGARQRTLTAAGHATSEVYQIKLGMTAYELDFFGRLRSLEEKALEHYLAMEQTHRSARINLVAEVAAAYLTWLADRELLAITEHTRDIETESYNLIAQRVSVGVANELELAQARTSLEAVKANLALYQRRAALAANYLSLLTGTDATQLLPDDDGSLDGRLIVVTPPDRLPSTVLLQRPDIMAAEHELKAAHADIGAARAAFFPAVTITANAGLISGELENLFDSGTGMWLFSPAIRLPIFTAGRLQAQLDAAELRNEIAIARYEKTIQTAFREAADALVAGTTYRAQLRAQEANLAANRDYHTMAGQRYEQGLDSFLTLLDAQRSLYAARQNYLSLKLADLINQVALYKALGGGWQERR